MKKIVLTGGGTAGHVMPNIALLKYLEKEFDEILKLKKNPNQSNYSIELQSI